MILGAVLLDFDGVMFDADIAEYTAIREIFSRRGFELPFEEWQGTVGQESPDWLARLVSPGSTSYRLLALEYERRRAAALAGQSLLPGVAGLLEAADVANVPVMVVARSDAKRARSELRRRELPGRPIVVEHESADDAADPEPYRQAVERLGVEPGRALAFEHSQDGVAAATGAGIRCVAVFNRFTHDHDFAAADLVVDRVDRLDARAVLRGDLASYRGEVTAATR